MDEEEQGLAVRGLPDLGAQRVDRSHGMPVDWEDLASRLRLRLGGRAVRGDLGGENARTRLQLALAALARRQITQGQAPASPALLAGVGSDLVLRELRDGHFQVAG